MFIFHLQKFHCLTPVWFELCGEKSFKPFFKFQIRFDTNQPVQAQKIENLDLGSRVFYVVKTKSLICNFVFAYAKIKFYHDTFCLLFSVTTRWCSYKKLLSGSLSSTHRSATNCTSYKFTNSAQQISIWPNFT